MTIRQVVALGGGGFSMEPDNLQLDRYILELTGKQSPKVGFLSPAESEGYALRFRQAFESLGATATALRVEPPSHENLEATVLAQDAIYVGGGDTATMVERWRRTGFAETLRKAYDAGIILAGVSAGSLCWFAAGLTDFGRPGADLAPIRALGFLSCSNCVHYDGEEKRRPSYHRALLAGMPAGYAADDGVALHFVDGVLYQAVSSRPDARAYRVNVQDGAVVESEIRPRYLGIGTVIRRATAADVDAMCEAHRRSIREIAAKDYSPEEIAAWSGFTVDEETRAVILYQIENDFRWVVEVDGKVLGFCHLMPPLGGVARLEALYLTPEVAGRGLARRLMQIAETTARGLGARQIDLMSSVTARGFYERLGFRPTGRPTRQNIRGRSLMAFPMSKELPQARDICDT